MKSFQDAHADIDLEIVTNSAFVDISRSGIDVAVRHGLGRYPGLRSDRVVTVEVVAVAAPVLVDRLGRPEVPADLAHWPHVHDADRAGWSLWFQTHGVDNVRILCGPSFDDTGLLLTAVLSGQGAGLLPAAMVASEIEAGQLIQLVQATHMEDFAYYLVCPDDKQGQPKIAAFRVDTGIDSSVLTCRSVTSIRALIKKTLHQNV